MVDEEPIQIAPEFRQLYAHLTDDELLIAQDNFDRFSTGPRFPVCPKSFPSGLHELNNSYRFNFEIDLDKPDEFSLDECLVV